MFPAVASFNVTLAYAMISFAFAPSVKVIFPAATLSLTSEIVFWYLLGASTILLDIFTLVLPAVISLTSALVKFTVE